MIDQPPAYAGIGRGEQRVGGDIEADMFHGRHGARAGKSRADGNFEGDFFVGRPLAVSAQFGEAFQNFSGRRAGIARAQGHTGITRSQGDGFVAAQELSFG